MILCINAVRARTGGAVTHLINFIRVATPQTYGFVSVHVWCNPHLFKLLPARSWLKCHVVSFPKTRLFGELFWEKFILSFLLRRVDCNVLLNVDAGSICRFAPSVTMSRDMLPFEDGMLERYPIGLSWLRILILKKIQINSLNKASGRVFLTKYANDKISSFLSCNQKTAIIPHGVSECFKFLGKRLANRDIDLDKEIACIYVSHFEVYKNQRNVAEAIANLRLSGYPITLDFIGGGSGIARIETENYCKKVDPKHDYIRFHEYVNHSELLKFMSKTSIFIFASSCENMPNTVLEGMSAGMVIACSNRGPMPEVLGNGGVYFDPLEKEEIQQAIKKIIHDRSLANQMSKTALALSGQYSWERCCDETLSFLAEVGQCK